MPLYCLSLSAASSTTVLSILWAKDGTSAVALLPMGDFGTVHKDQRFIEECLRRAAGEDAAD